MNASDILNFLTSAEQHILGGDELCPTWVERAALVMAPPSPLQGDRPYETTAVNFFPETTVRPPAEGLTRRGKPRLQRRRLDLVALVQPHYKHFEPFVIGVEIKVSSDDLLRDNKIADYLPYCHLFYLAVPHGLKEMALIKLATETAYKDTGLLCITDTNSQACGDVWIAQQAAPRQPSDTCLKELYAELLIRPFKVSQEDRAQGDHVRRRKVFVQFA